MNLDGIRVLDLSRLLPGPYATQLLAEMGAEVIRIERPGDAQAGPTLESINRGKRRVALNLKTEGGREAFLELAATADVVLEQFRPGVVDRLGVDYDAIREVNPGIVYCSLSGYGQTGPYSDRVGHDLNYIGLAGLLDMTRQSDDEMPRVPGYQVADIGGGLFAALSIVGALLSRELGAGDRNGAGDRAGADNDATGEYIDVSLTDAAVSFSQAVAPRALAGGDPRPGETPLTGQFPWYDVYPAAEGYVTLAALEPHFWRAFCEAVDREEWIEYHMTTDSAELETLREALESLFETRTRDEWVSFFEGVDAAVGGVYTPAEMVDHPQIAARGYVSGGPAAEEDKTSTVGFPARGTDIDHDGPTAVAEHGDDTESVLQEIGYETAALEQLRVSGAIPE
ncbi:CaiB/BaiF CoA transferase family protein [Natrialba sp. SSL1]|uniref:CaiB/BaiF CoA transferase family protein n=1 Tax=Natrialba sp. SSL1 TaxID=1869245 RepID=UPI0008F83560|nr:CaiB/BaiF CoA-transferase family protein [Natrialba sp. SSL1]OIB59050.1 carnitine dehydratase [Natrialba sp. SSL1]